MKTFLGMGALALALAGVPTDQAAASGIKFNFGIGINLNFEYAGHQRWCGRGCFGHRGGDYVAVMPEHGHHAMQHAEPFPPQPMPERRDPRGGDRKRDEANMQWGYPSLGYSYYHPVSYYPPQYQANPAAATYYYPQHYYYPANNGYPNYYQAPGITFDR